MRWCNLEKRLEGEVVGLGKSLMLGNFVIVLFNWSRKCIGGCNGEWVWI